MPINRPTQQHLEREDFEALEADWLSRLSEDPSDLDYAVGVARALAGRQQDERAQLLLELWDEELVARDLWPARLTLLRRAGTLLVDPEWLHHEIARTLAAMFPDHTRFAGLVELAGLHRAIDDVEKLWSKTDRLLTLLPYGAGTVVAMSPQGVGRVVEVNVELEKLKVEFANGTHLMVGFRAAPKTLTRLTPDHILHQKLEQPDELRRLATDEPAELLRRVLTSADHPLTATEIRETLADIVPTDTWTSWWNAARRHPQLLHQGQGRAAYTWAETAADAEESLWTRFAAAPPAVRIDMLRRHADTSHLLAARMRDTLIAQATQLIDRDPATALHIALAMDRNPQVRATDGDLPDPIRLLAQLGEPVTTLLQIEDRGTREEAYRLLPEARDDWPELAETLMRRESQPQAVAVLGELLSAADARRVEQLMDDVLGQPRKTPAAFLWLLERARDQEEIRNRSPLRLLKQLLQALEWDEFKRARRSLAAELDSGGVVARLITSLKAEQAHQAAEALKRAPIEGFQRAPLLNALQLHFPDDLAELTGKQQDTFYALPVSIAAKREELRHLQEVEIPANRKAIQEARELGDLRENFEYKAARQRHEYLAARVAALDGDLGRARPIDLDAADVDRVRVGCRVTLEAADGTTRSLTILGPWESDPERGVLSHESELAQKLLDRGPGDTIELPEGVVRVESVSRAAVQDP
ncbi:MAG: GreA/GreB family elongation factor [Thermoanaerobaculia bacterium]